MSFSLHHATLQDIPQITDVWYKAFPNITKLIPDNPACREWANESWSNSLTSPVPNNRALFFVIKDDSKDDKPVVAFARYFNMDSTWTEDWKQRYSPNLPREVVEEKLNEGFLLPMARQHRVALQQRPHYFLECLATLPAYQRRGLGSMLLKEGNKRADDDGLESYLDASKKGAPLYERFGYVVQDVKDGEAKAEPMLRAVDGKPE